MSVADARWIPTNLPLERTSFVGRTADLARLGALVRSGQRLITLTGPGGAGKTRVARRFGAELLAASPQAIGSAWFVDLAEARTPADIVAAVSAAIDVPLVRGTSSEEASLQIAHALAARQPLLLILDNFEQLVAFSAATVGAWRDRAGGVVFVVTSRTPLHLEGEALVEVGPLEVTDALELFEARARLVVPSFRARENATALSDLARRLDGNALAIELAAARIKVLPPPRLLERLSERLDLLRSANRDALPRHTTLRSTLESSWELLGAEEKRALAVCSVFQGDFDLEAAEAVVRSVSAVDLIEGLVEHSLITRRGGAVEDDVVRFRLSETVRDYASEKLIELGEATCEETESRHAEHYLARIEAAVASTLAPWCDVVDRAAARDVDQLMAIARRSVGGDVRVTMRAALVLDAILRPRSSGGALRAVLDAAIARAAECADAGLSVLLFAASADEHRLHAKLVDARRDAERAQGAAASAGARESSLSAVVLAEIELDEGNLEAARVAAERAVSVARSAADRRLEALALSTVARLHVDEDDLGNARLRCTEALEMTRTMRAPLLVSRLQKLLGVIAARSSLLDEAEACYESAVATARELSDTYLELTGSVNVADIRGRRGDHEVALAGFRDVIALAVGVGFRRVQGVALNHLGLVLHDSEQLAAARDAHAEGNAIHRDIGNHHSLAFGLDAFGLLALEEQTLDEADALLTESLEIARAAGLSAVVASSAASLAVVRAIANEPARSRDSLAEALAAARAVNRPEPTGLVALLEALVRVVEARAERADSLDEELAAAGERHRLGVDVASRSARCRIARRMLARALDSPTSGPVSKALGSGALHVADEARSFRRVGSTAVDLSTRRALRRLLLELTKLRLERPGSALTLEALFEVGWPGERITQSAAFRRVYTAIGSLRDYGLRDVLVRREDGYLLSPKIDVVLSSDEL